MSSTAGPDQAEHAGAPASAPVLVADLDGTLIVGDTLWETLWAGLAARPWETLAALGALAEGRAALKARLAAAGALDPGALVYDERVLERLRAHRAEGGRTALATAADARVAEAVAAHLGLFDAVHASDGERNLKAAAKAAFLTERYGAGGFDYIGDSEADLAVWAEARRAVTVGLAPAHRGAVKPRSGAAEHLERGAPGMAAYLRLIRPHQWLKNLLVFLPVLAAHDLSGASLGLAALAFLSFSLVASGVYVVNDLFDLGPDRAHPRKRRRPLASGAVPLLHGMALAPVLFVAGLGAALATGEARFVAVMAAYLVLTTAYSVRLKRMLLIDICVLAGLYTVRIIAGGAATETALSVWLLAFSIFFFFSLAAVKRLAEIVGLAPEKAQAAGRAYRREDRQVVSTMAVAAGYLSVLVLALYLDSESVRALYTTPELLWLVSPILLYWVSRMVLITERGGMTDDPIVFAIKDRVSAVCALAILVVGVAGAVW